MGIQIEKAHAILSHNGQAFFLCNQREGGQGCQAFPTFIISLLRCAPEDEGGGGSAEGPLLWLTRVRLSLTRGRAGDRGEQG